MNPFSVALAESTFKAFGSGEEALSSKQIAEAYYEKPLVGQDAIKEVGKYLKQVISILLEADPERSFHPVNDAYFFRGNTLITNMEEAKKYLPWGGGNKFGGIRIVQNEGDILFQTWLELCGSSGAGALRSTANRIIEANNRHNLSDNNALDIVENLRRKGIPDSLAIIEKRVKKLK